jgi:hypothetical protein
MFARRRLWFAWMSAWLAAASVIGGVAPSTQPAPRPGKSTATWPLLPQAEFEASYTALATRSGLKIPADYPRKKREQWLSETGVSDPTYEVYVPRSAGPGGKYGLLVWISPGPNGGAPREDWLAALNRHKLIWVGPNHVGNEVDGLLRAYMSLDAVRNAKQQFPIDDARVFVAGMSGGGRLASRAAVVAADTFTGGGMFVCGCDFYRDVPEVANDIHGRYYRGFWPKPDPKLLKLAKQHRYVLVTGTEDMNRLNTHSVHDGFLKATFAHVTLFEVPGMGHTVPDGAWFEKALTFLDSPDATPATTKPGAATKPGATTKPSTRPSRGVIRVGPEQRPVR